MQKVMRKTVEVLVDDGTKIGNARVRLAGQEHAPVSGFVVEHDVVISGEENEMTSSTKAEIELTPEVCVVEQRPTMIWPLPHAYDDLALLRA